MRQSPGQAQASHLETTPGGNLVAALIVGMEAGLEIPH